MAQAENENSNSHGFHGDATKTFHFGGISDNPQNGKSLGMADFISKASYFRVPDALLRELNLHMFKPQFWQ